MTDSTTVRSAASGSGASSGTRVSTVAAAKRRQLVLLAGLAVVLGALVVFVLVPALSGGSVAPAPAPAPQPASGRTAAPGRGEAVRREVVDVHLERLQAAAAAPEGNGRNPFRMGPAPPPPGTAASRPAAPATPLQAVAPTGPPLPPPAPAIPYRFIGIVTGGGQAGKIAVLSDGRTVQSGREGEVIDGRYRIVRIGEESIQMEHVDGRGRQTIRLTGQ